MLGAGLGCCIIMCCSSDMHLRIPLKTFLQWYGSFDGRPCIRQDQLVKAKHELHLTM